MFAVEDTRAKLICNRMLLLEKKKGSKLKIAVSRVCLGVGGESGGLDLVSESFRDKRRNK